MSLGRVLVVEDSAQVASMIRDVIVALGYEGHASPNGEDALRRVPTYHPDVILLDLDLPGISGGEVLSALRRDHPEIPVVMVTGNQDETTARATLDHGAFDYLSKPFDIDVIGRVLKAAMVYRAR
jgi:CheY-like chemotaxis protein